MTDEEEQNKCAESHIRIINCLLVLTFRNDLCCLDWNVNSFVLGFLVPNHEMVLGHLFRLKFKNDVGGRFKSNITSALQIPFIQML